MTPDDRRATIRLDAATGAARPRGTTIHALEVGPDAVVTDLALTYEQRSKGAFE